jgi:hypothetical protein
MRSSPPLTASRSGRRRSTIAWGGALLCLWLLIGTAIAAPETAGGKRHGRTVRALRTGFSAAVSVTRWGASLATSRAFALSLRGFGAIGAGGLIVTSAHGLATARGAADRLDAGSDLAWGLRGLSTYAAGAGASTGWLHAAQGLGAVGALCQVGAGSCRIRLGLERHDRSLVRIGALDLAGGLLSLSWNLLGVSSPWLIGAYAATMAVREIYANREPLKAFARRAGQKVRCTVGRCKAFATSTFRRLGESLE